MIHTYTKQVADTHSTVAKIICNLTMQYNTTVIFDAKGVQKMPQRIVKAYTYKYNSENIIVCTKSLSRMQINSSHLPLYAATNVI